MRDSRLMLTCIVLALALTTAGCKSNRGEDSASRSTEKRNAHPDAATSRDPAHHRRWTLRRVLDTALPLLGKPIADVKKHYGNALAQKAAGYVLTLPAIGDRGRPTFVTLDGDERISEAVVLFDLANDGDAIRAELMRRWGKPRTSREHKCRLHGCVYGNGPVAVVKPIETSGVWSIRLRARP